MEDEGTLVVAKRMKPSEENERSIQNRAVAEVPGEDTELSSLNSEQIEMVISHILEKINHFTQLVSELLESGKSMLKELSTEYEERMISIHKEQMEKWQEEIKELRLLDASNEEVDTVLQNAKYLFQNVRGSG